MLWYSLCVETETTTINETNRKKQLLGGPSCWIIKYKITNWFFGRLFKFFPFLFLFFFFPFLFSFPLCFPFCFVLFCFVCLFVCFFSRILGPPHLLRPCCNVTFLQVFNQYHTSNYFRYFFGGRVSYLVIFSVKWVWVVFNVYTCVTRGFQYLP